MTGFPRLHLRNRPEQGVSPQKNTNRANHIVTIIIPKGNADIKHMCPKRRGKGQVAHKRLRLLLLHDRQPPKSLPIEKGHLWKGTQHQRALIIHNDNREIIRLSNRMPLNQIIRGVFIDKHRKLILTGLSPPTVLPFLNETPNLVRILVDIAPVGANDRITNKWNGRQLLSFIDTPNNLSLDFASNFNRNPLHGDPGSFPKCPLFFEIGQEERKDEGKKPN